MKTWLSKLDEPEKCLVIAEVAQAHEGSLGMAHAYIDAIAETGADAIKFQTHIAEAESTINEPWRVKFSFQDRTRFDYWKRMEFSKEQWLGLANHARERGLIFISSPFSMEAVDLLEELEMPVWKIGSGEITNIPMIDRIILTGKPIYLSTGMCTYEELDYCVERIKSSGNELVVMQCTSAYPCQPEDIGINMLDIYRKRYKTKVGLSDHSGSIYPALVASAKGASVVELHVTFSRKMFGPDVSSSLTIDELTQVVNGIDFISRMMRNPVNKNSMSERLKEIRQVFYKSVVAARDLPAGAILEESMLKTKKAGSGGIEASRIEEFIGKRLLHGVKADEKLVEEDFEQ